MSEPRRPALAASVAPLAATQHGLDAELTLDVPSDIQRVAEAVDVVTREAESRFGDRRRIRFNLRVALGEALANAILYGNKCDPAKGVAIRARLGRNAIELEVKDQGDGFDPSAVPDPTTPDRITSPSGRGLFLIRRLMDDVRFNAKGNVICMVLRRA